MHIIQVVRNYLGMSQKQLSQNAGITQPDLCEMETKAPYGRIDKYKRLSEYLGIPVHALVTDSCAQIPLSFFERFPSRPYSETVPEGLQALGRGGEDMAFDLERKRLEQVNPVLARLVLPFYKLRYRPGYDILSFDDSGRPIYIEVKTSQDDATDFILTKQEYEIANKLTAAGETYQIFRFTNWGRDSQKWTVYDFRELKESREMTPATYLCSAASGDDTITGIRYCRELRGMSKGELADCLGIKTPDLWRYENGRRQCPVGVYQKLAQILEVSIDQLLEDYPALTK